VAAERRTVAAEPMLASETVSNSATPYGVRCPFDGV